MGNIKRGIELARKHNRVDRSNRERNFRDMTPTEIRNTLKAYGLNPHMEVWFDSVEIAIITPQGLLMKKSVADNGKISLWGGILERDEGPGYGAIRIMHEETGLILSKNDLTPDEFHSHSHRYANGDRGFFYCNRFIMRTDAVPSIVYDEATTSGTVIITAESLKHHNVVDSQRNFIERLLDI